MTPTPPAHSSFQSHFRFRRPRNTNGFDRSPNTTNVADTSVNPTSDRGATPGGDGGVEGLEDDHEHADVEIDDGRDEVGDDDAGSNLEEGEIDVEEEEGAIEEVPMDLDIPFDPAALGYKEIGNLASWTVSSCKPGCGVEALRDDDTSLFWQSDGPQPHHLNIHFSRLVSILSIRIFLDFEADESYTPTRITLLAGTGYHDLIPFSALEFSQPKGWIDVPLDEVGGGADGKTLRAFLVQVRIVENHQNGKDTHVRGLKVFARDERLGGKITLDVIDGVSSRKKRLLDVENGDINDDLGGKYLIGEPDWARDEDLR